MTEFSSVDYGIKNPEDYKCPTCAHRLNKKGQIIKIMDSSFCKTCIMRKNHPNYKADVRLINMHLDEFPELKDFFKEKPR